MIFLAPFVVPVAYAVGTAMVIRLAKKNLSNAIAREVNGNVDIAIYKGTSAGTDKAVMLVEHQFNEKMLAQGISALISILLILSAVFLGPYFLSHGNSVLILSLVYIGLAGNSFWSMLTFVYENRNFFIEYKLNLRKYVYDRVYSEACSEARSQFREEYNSMNFIARFFFDNFSSKNEDKIVKELASNVAKGSVDRLFKYFLVRAAFVLFVFLAYIVIFRFIIAPKISVDATGMGVVELFLYPFVASFEKVIGISVNWF